MGLSFPQFFQFLIILSLALSVRLLYWSDARAYSVGADEPDYVVPAQGLVRDGRYVDTFVSRGRPWTRVPLTSALFAGAFLFVPDAAAYHAEGDDDALMQPRYDALNLAQIGVSLVTVALIMLLAARAFPQRARRAALIAGVIAALYPPLASSPAQRTLSEPLSILLLVAALYALSWWSPDVPRRSVWVAVIAGVLLGLGALTRSVAVAFLPFVWMWFFIVYHAGSGLKRSKSGWGDRIRGIRQWPRRYVKPLVGAGVTTALCLLVIAPWTFYNYLQYRSFLLLETANATAYWNYHNYRGEDYFARLAVLPNPADRLSLIVKEGTANILEYPDKALQTSMFAFGYFWHLESNSAVLMNPWDMTQRDPDVPDLLHSDAAFILVGLAGMCGLLGVGMRRPVDKAGRTLLLVNLWLLCMVLLGIVVPYDARYRLPAAPSLILLASGLLALADWRTVFSPVKAWISVRQHWKGVVAALLLCFWVVLGAYTPRIPPLLGSVYQSWRGDMALDSGDVSGAFGRYDLAEQAFPTFYWPLRHAADKAREVRKDDYSRALYAEARRRYPDDPYGILGFAALVSRHAEWRLTQDERQWLNHDESEWRGNPWNSFQPPPAISIDVGTGWDIGYIRGFHKRDRLASDLDYRWSKGRATVRIPVPSGGIAFASVTLRMSAPAVGPSEPMPVTISVNDSQPIVLSVPIGWADYRLPLPQGAASPGKTLILDIQSPTRNPSQLQPGSSETRNLGVGVDRVALTGSLP